MKAILPVFDASTQRPYYLQLYDYIRDAILSGEIAEGEKLPSLRALSRSTGFSITTIENAYNQLLVEGYINARASSGYYAGKVDGTGEQPAAKAGLRKTVPLKNAKDEKKLSFDNPIWPRTGPVFSPNADAVGDETAETTQLMRYDPSCFDFNKWKKCMNRVLSEHSSALFFEGSPQGEEPLRNEIARYLYLSRGVSCSPDQIFIAAGTQQITGLLASMLKDLKIEHVSLEDPGYAPVRNTFRDRGFAISDVRVDDDGIDLQAG